MLSRSSNLHVNIQMVVAKHANCVLSREFEDLDETIVEVEGPKYYNSRVVDLSDITS